MAEPRAKTVDEARDKLLRMFAAYAEYWAKQQGTALDRCNGLAFSILSLFDGATVELPGMDIVLRPPKDDMAYHASQGENWWPDGLVVNATQLHEMWHRYERKAAAA